MISFAFRTFSILWRLQHYLVKNIFAISRCSKLVLILLRYYILVCMYLYCVFLSIGLLGWTNVDPIWGLLLAFSNQVLAQAFFFLFFFQFNLFRCFRIRVLLWQWHLTEQNFPSSLLNWCNLCHLFFFYNKRLLANIFPLPDVFVLPTIVATYLQKESDCS